MGPGRVRVRTLSRWKEGSERERERAGYKLPRPSGRGGVQGLPVPPKFFPPPSKANQSNERERLLRLLGPAKERESSDRYLPIAVFVRGHAGSEREPGCCSFFERSRYSKSATIRMSSGSFDKSGFWTRSL